MDASDSPDAQLKALIARFTPSIATLTDACLAKLREKIPNAIRLVYDNYAALVIGFGPSERPSEAILSLAVYPRHVNLNFLQGSSLPDPNKLLQGCGSKNRFVKIDRPAALDDPAIQALMEQALSAAAVPFRGVPGYVVIKSVSKKKRPRRLE